MQTRTDPKELGRQGEQRAAAWYHDAGYEIVARNWRCEHGEIDLVVCSPDVLVFCEVKSRASNRWGSPAEAVTVAKQHRVRKLASAWLQNEPIKKPGLRFDVACFVHGELTVIENAF